MKKLIIMLATHNIKCLALIFIAIATIISCMPPDSSDKSIVFEGATLIVGNDTQPIENAVVVVRGDKIIHVGTKGEITYPNNSQIINLKDKWLLPGFMDLHFHINNTEQQEILNTFLQFGITTVRNTAPTPKFGIQLRDKKY